MGDDEARAVADLMNRIESEHADWSFDTYKGRLILHVNAGGVHVDTWYISREGGTWNGE